MSIPKTKTFDDAYQYECGTFDVENFLVNSDPLSEPEHIMTPRQRPLEYPRNGYLESPAKDENQEHNELPPLSL
jgi:hypothetical protein